MVSGDGKHRIANHPPGITSIEPCQGQAQPIRIPIRMLNFGIGCAAPAVGGRFFASLRNSCLLSVVIGVHLW